MLPFEVPLYDLDKRIEEVRSQVEDTDSALSEQVRERSERLTTFSSGEFRPRAKGLVGNRSGKCEVDTNDGD
jgi:hypothetical protein